MADIISDINAYFDQPTPAACDAIATRSAGVVPAGFAVIISRLQTLAAKTMQPSFMMTDPNALDRMIEAAGGQLLERWLDVITRCGAAGTTQVLDALKHQDADMRALAALELVSQDLRQVPALPELSAAYRRSRGTGVRIAVAMAMLAHGHMEAIKELVEPYLLPAGMPAELLDTARRVVGSGESAEDVVIQMITVPRGFPLVIMDIATKGAMPRSRWSSWVRE